MKTWLKRAAAAVLSLSLLAAPVLAAAETAGSSTLNLSDNTVYTYSTQSVTSDSGKQTNLHENIFTYRKEAQVRPVVAFGSTLYGTSAMNKTIKTLEEQGYSMVAGINGSFFDRSTGIPYGIVITNSILRSGGSANAVGFLADGSAVIGDPEVTVTLDYGGDTPLLVNYNKAMTTQNGVLLYSQDYDTRTKNTIEGYHVIVRPSGSRAAELRLSQTLTVEVVGMVEDTKSCAIPEDGFLLAIANDTIYKNALAAKAVKRDEQMTMKLLHRLISCYDGLYDEKRKAETVKLLMQNAQEAGDSGMESIALFYLGKSLHEQGTKERGYVYMLQATEMMEKSHYDRKYDNLRANCNDLLICYERDKRYGEALQVLDKLEKYLYAKTPGEAEMEGLYEQEKCKWLAHRAVVCSKLGKEKEANEAYSEFQKMGRINRRYAYLVVPYLFDLHRYDEIVDMCKQRETEMMHKKDTINLYMSSTLKFYGMAYQGLEQYDKAASYFERLSVLRDSLRVRELRSSSQELSIIYDVKDKEAQITHQRWELVIAICILIALAIIGCVLGYNNRIIRKKNISLVANVKEAMRYKEELEKLNRSTLSENIAWNDDEDPDLLLFEQIKVKIIDQKFFLDNTFSRKALMGEFNIPANKFAGLFRQFTGKSFSEYINDLRIEYVAELLLSGKYASVEELLKECTFISSTSLYRLFTKKYGMTPQKFLRNARLC